MGRFRVKLAFVLLLVLGLPALWPDSAGAQSSRGDVGPPWRWAAAGDGMSPADRARVAFFEILTFLYVLTLGATVGSFLNVVAYRMPRGLGLLWPPSRCPICETPIRLRDNVPVLGWLALRGRCRDCDAPISPRYAFVEGLTALLFLALAYGELLSGGANLPLRLPNLRTGVIWILWETKWDLVRIYFYHCALLCWMLAAALMGLDGRGLPRRFVMAGLLLGLLLPLAWPDVRPIPAFRSGNGVLDAQPGAAIATAARPAAWREGLIDGAAGVAAGVLLGALFAVAHRQLPGGNPPPAATTALSIAGVFLGWQTAVSMALLATVVLFAAAVSSRLSSRIAPSSFLACLAISALAQILLWRWLFGRGWWPFREVEQDIVVDWPLMAVAGISAAALIGATRFLWRSQQAAPNADVESG